MNFYHMADLHLGAKNNKLPPEKGELLKSERLEILRDLFLRARDEADFVLIAGDLFHSKSPQAKLVNNFFNMVREFALPVVYIRGNHDEKWEGVAPDNFIILSQENYKFSIGNVDIWANVDGIKIRNEFDQTRKNILMLHGNIENSSDNDFVDIKEYADIPFDYVAMGHIHSFKSFDIYNKTFVYSGSLFSNGFDECGEKGFVEVNLDKKTYKFIGLEDRRFWVCEVDKGNAYGTNEIIQKIRETISGRVSHRDILRVELFGYFEEDEDKNNSMIKQAFSSQFYFEFIDKTRLKINIDKVKQESLSFKAEFIKLVEESNLTDEDKNAVCLIGIEALKGEDLSI